jgi:small subunit ribosomal protein S25e
MGGVKKKSMASMEKTQDSSGEEQSPGQPQKGKKTKEKAAPQQQKRLPFLVPKMTQEEMVKALTPLKAITLYSASRVLGVNASIASGVLRSLESRNLITRVGGFSGHYVWAVASAS